MAKAKISIAALTSRRNFIKSSAAALAVASASTVALSMAGLARDTTEHPDLELFKAIAEWQRGHAEQERLGDAVNQLEVLAGETEPPRPSELFEALDMPGGKRPPSDMTLGWDESSLRRWVDDGLVLQTSGGKLPKDGLRTYLWWDDIPQATRQRVAELLQVKMDYTAKLDAHWQKAKEAEDRYGDQVSKQSDKMMEIVEMPVFTGKGLAAKCQMLLDEPMFGDLGGEAGFIAKSLIADIQDAVESGVIGSALTV